MNKKILTRLFEVIMFVLSMALGVIILTLGFRMLFEIAKSIFK